MESTARALSGYIICQCCSNYSEACIDISLPAAVEHGFE